MNDPIKKPYSSPAILEHSTIAFETIISSIDNSSPSDGNKQTPFPNENSSPNRGSSPKEGYTPPASDSLWSKFNPFSNDSPGQTNPSWASSQDPLPIPDSTAPSEDDPSFIEALISEINHEDTVNPPASPNENSQSKLPEEGQLLPVNHHPLSARSEVQALASQSYYDLPNTGTHWYTVGLEGVIVASLSGLALWLRQREERKNDPMD